MQGVYRSATFESKTAAKAWAADIETQIRAGTLGVSAGGTVADVLDKYARTVSPSKRGARWEELRLAAIGRDSLAEIPIRDVRRGDIADYRDRRLANVAPGTVNRELNLLSAVFRTAVEEWHWLTENPCAGLRRPPSPQGRDRRISDDEVERVCMALGYEGRVETKQHQVALVFLIALETAMRAGEILSLDWSRVDLKARHCTLEMTKNGTRRQVPLSTRAVGLLQQAPGRKGPLFDLTSRSLDVLFRRARDKAQIKDLRFHDSRHEAITRLAQKLDILDLARMVGHQNLGSLRVYYNPTASEIAARLD